METHTYLIRIELRHMEHEADYESLHGILHSFRMYRVIYNRISRRWLDLSLGQYLATDTPMALGKCLEVAERTARQLITDRGYSEGEVPALYSILVSEVARSAEAKPLLLGTLQPTADPKRLPPGELL